MNTHIIYLIVSLLKLFEHEMKQEKLQNLLSAHKVVDFYILLRKIARDNPIKEIKS